MDLAQICINGELNIGDLLVGVGTLLLAGFTYRLARLVATRAPH